MKARLIVMIDYEVDDDNYPDEAVTAGDKALIDLETFQSDSDFTFDQLFNGATEPLITVIPLD